MGSGKHLTVETLRRMRADVESGMFTHPIAEKYDVARQTVERWAKTWRKESGEQKTAGRETALTEAQLFALEFMWVHHFTGKQMAPLLGCTPSSAYRRMRELRDKYNEKRRKVARLQSCWVDENLICRVCGRPDPRLAALESYKWDGPEMPVPEPCPGRRVA